MLPKYYKNETIWKMSMSFFGEPLRRHSGFPLLCILSVCCGRSNDFFSLWWKTVANPPHPHPTPTPPVILLFGDKRMSFLDRKKTFSPSRFRIWVFVFPFCKPGSTVVRITNLPVGERGRRLCFFVFVFWIGDPFIHFMCEVKSSPYRFLDGIPWNSVTMM